MARRWSALKPFEPRAQIAANPYRGALPAGKWSHGGEFIVESCPGCGKRDKFYFNVQKGTGYCYSCGFVISTEKGIYEAWPELRGRPGGERPAIHVDYRVSLMNPERFGISAWDAEEPRNTLIGWGISEQLARRVPIWYLPDERAMAIMMDPMSPEYQPFSWIRRLPEHSSKWMPAGPVRGSVYAFGLRFLKPGREEVVVCEGTSDILRGGLLGRGVALLGTQANRNQALCKYFRDLGVKRVVLWLDADPEGQAGQAELVPHFGSWFEVRTIVTDRDPKYFKGCGPALLDFFAKVYPRRQPSPWVTEFWEQSWHA